MMSLRENYSFDLPRRKKREMRTSADVAILPSFPVLRRRVKMRVICPERLETEEFTVSLPRGA